MLNSIDLFAGAGGLSEGLKAAGFRSLLANEIVPAFAKTYRYNNPEAKLIVGDVKEVEGQEIKRMLGIDTHDLDLLAGGPPCQGFSVNAPIRSLDDERNHLFKDFLKIAEALKPKAILIENVPGIVSLGKGTVVEQIYKELYRLGYTVGHRILFAGHFGVPQMRFRTIFLAYLGQGEAAKIDFPSPRYDSIAKTNFTGAKELCQVISAQDRTKLLPSPRVWDALSDLPPIESGNDDREANYLSLPNCDYQLKLRNGSSKVYNHVCAGIGKINQQRLAYIPQGGSWRDIPYELLPTGLQRARRSDHTKRYGRLHPDQLCSTILTKCDPHWGSFFHPTQDRVISVREAARIQSFPDTFVFLGSLSEQYEQVGNAVPPMLAEAIGKEIRKTIGHLWGVEYEKSERPC